MFFRIFLTGFLISISLIELWAQPTFKKTRYAVEQGLSHNTVLNLSMDERGFLWVATMDGLNRFDGLQMKVFRPNPKDSLSLTDGFIHGIHQHETGDLWVSTRDGGINIFNPVTESFKHFDRGNKEAINFPDRQLSLLYEDSRDNYWIAFFGHSSGIINPETKVYYPANIVDGETGRSRSSVNAFLEFGDGSMLFTSLNGLFYLPVKEVEKFLSNPGSSQNIYAVPVRYSDSNPFPNSVNMKVDSKGNFWVNLVTSGLEKMSPEFIPDFLKQSFTSGVVRNSSDNLVVERDGFLISGYLSNQLLFVNLETGKQTVSKLDPGINLQGATYLYEDPNKELWVYTWGGGFYKLEQKKGIALINNTTNPGTFESNFMLGFEEDRDGFWLGTGAEVQFYDSGKNTFLPLNKRLSNTQIFGIWDFEREESGLWIVTVDKGLVFINKQELQKKEGITARRFTSDNSIIKSKNLHTIFKDSRGWLWLGYEGEGIQIIKNPDALIDGSVLNVSELTSGTEGERVTISSLYIREFYEDRGGDIWVATNDSGFDRIRMQNGTVESIRNFKHDSEDEDSIPHNDGRSIFQVTDTTFWFATYGGGIAKWNSAADKITRYTTEEGLPNNSTYSILGEDNSRYIWTSTNSGLARFDTQTETFDVFTEDDGLQNNEFNTGAYLKRTNGNLIFGGINGFNIINPEELKKNDRVPPVYITEIELFGEPLSTDTSATAIKNIELKYDQNFLSFDFAALDFENPAENRFAYKMEGVDDDWVYSENRNFAGYPNLQPGDYTFMVKAANNDGLWNETGTSLNIRITPPWWQTLWFRLISGILLFTGVVLGVRYFSQKRLREQIRKMEIENKLRNERERISRDLHDHVGSQLANIMSGLALADKYNQVDNKEKSSSLMHSLKGDAEVTIKQLRETIWALNQNALDLKTFKDHLRTYFKNQTAFVESINISYEIEGDEKSRLSSTQALNLFRIIQEASQNTLKYAEAENIEIKFFRKNGALTVVIKDDGSFKGEKKTFNGGYGFGNMKKRAEELGGEVSVKTEDGTEIKVNIPM
ncbi:MAG: triple tyrosine motif-containing protein [Balneola sp.]